MAHSTDDEKGSGNGSGGSINGTAGNGGAPAAAAAGRRAAARLLDPDLLRSLEAMTAAGGGTDSSGRHSAVTAAAHPGRHRSGKAAAVKAGSRAGSPALPRARRSSSGGRTSAPRIDPLAAFLAPSLGTDAPSRLRQLFDGLFAATDDLSIHLLLDATYTMGSRTNGLPGAATKFQYARKLAAALGYVSLTRFGRFGLCPFGQARGRRKPRLSGPGAADRLFSYLDDVVPGGFRDFSGAVLDYAQRTADAPGVFVIVSDFLSPHWERAIRALFDRQFRVVLVQVLDPDEVEPTFLEHLRLVDAGTGAARELGVAPQVLSRYRAALASFCGQLSDAAERHKMGYVRLTTDVAFERPLLQTLRHAGLLR